MTADDASAADTDTTPDAKPPTTADGPVEHPTGERQAEENADNEPPA